MNNVDSDIKSSIIYFLFITLSVAAFVGQNPILAISITDADYSTKVQGVGNLESLNLDLKNDGGSGRATVDILFLDDKGYILEKESRTLEIDKNERKILDFDVEQPEHAEKLRVRVYPNYLDVFIF